MSDLISRQAAITLPVMPKEHREYQTFNLDDAYELGWFDCQKCIDELPSAQPERKTGKWLEKEVLHKAEAETVIEEWQSCKCSVCGRYDTRPYLYYFDEPHFCSWCGADMKEDGKQDE